MRWGPSGHATQNPNQPSPPPQKNKRKKQTNNKTKLKEGLGDVRCPFGPPCLKPRLSKPPPPRKEIQKRKKTTTEKHKIAGCQKCLFLVFSNFPLKAKNSRKHKNGISANLKTPQIRPTRSPHTFGEILSISSNFNFSVSSQFFLTCVSF